MPYVNLDRSPSEHPLTYPGAVAERSALLVNSWLYNLEPAPDVPVSRWAVRADGGPLLLRDDDVLDGVLSTAGVPPIALRSPVVAVGSNASPAQLAYKYRECDGHSVIPITRAIVSNLSLAHSAHISIPGYVPFIPILARDRAPVTLHILWLDVNQLRRMDETEPNYTRVAVLPSVSSAALETGAELPSFTLYRGRWGALRAGTDAEPVKATSQTSLFSMLSTLAWFLALVPELREGAGHATSALARDAGRRERVRQELASRMLVASDDLSVNGVVAAPAA